MLESIYPALRRGDGPKARAGKKKLSSEAQRRMNQKYSWQKLELMLAANFRPGDLVCTLTFDEAHLPRDRKECEYRLRYMRQRLGKVRKGRGQSLTMFWSIEHKHGEGRWHVHAVLNATGEDYQEILKAWGQGEVELTPLRVDRKKNYETQARYMCKEERDKVGLRAWSYTRGARKPETETFRVEEDTPLDVPRGATLIQESSERTEYGCYRYIKYLSAGWDGRRAVRAKRGRRKKR